MKLTIAASNKNRLKLNHDISDYFIKSVQWQTFTDFELLIADGGSDNYEELKDYFAKNTFKIPVRFVQYKIGDVFLRSLLNNVGVRNANGEYAMTTDVDMLFAPKFVETLVSKCQQGTFVESRTMYLKSCVTSKIYSGELDPYNNLDSIKRGRIKKRTTAGGCQCMKRTDWDKIQFDESYYGWGSEDYDLLTRVEKSGMNVVWIGESHEDIMLFHQSHFKPDNKKDLEYQEENKKRLAVAGKHAVNINGWGGVYDK